MNCAGIIPFNYSSFSTPSLLYTASFVTSPLQLEMLLWLQYLLKKKVRELLLLLSVLVQGNLGLFFFFLTNIHVRDIAKTWTNTALVNREEEKTLSF